MSPAKEQTQSHDSSALVQCRGHLIIRDDTEALIRDIVLQSPARGMAILQLKISTRKKKIITFFIICVINRYPTTGNH